MQRCARTPAFEPRPVFHDPRAADPARQFDLVAKHIARIRMDTGRKASRVFVYVERNLGFEAGTRARATQTVGPALCLTHLLALTKSHQRQISALA